MTYNVFGRTLSLTQSIKTMIYRLQPQLDLLYTGPSAILKVNIDQHEERYWSCQRSCHCIIAWVSTGKGKGTSTCPLTLEKVVKCFGAFVISGRSRTCKLGAKVERRPIFLLILNLKLSNSSHSERHFCSLATYCTSKKHCFWPPAGGMPPPLNPPLLLMTVKRSS